MMQMARSAWNWLRQRRGIHPRDPALVALLGAGGDTASGARVTETTALNVTTVHACVRILAETLASVPLGMVRLLGKNGKESAPEHPLHELLANQPCPEVTAFTFREVLMAHLGLRGNGLAYIQRNGGGRPIELWPLRPDRVLPRRVDGKLVYTVFVPSRAAMGWSGELDTVPVLETHTPVTLPADVIFHVRNFSLDGIIGLSPISLMREAVGLALATEEYGARHFSNSARPGGILEHPGRLSKEAKENLKSSFEKVHQGLSNANKLAVLEEGLKWTKISFTPEDSQFLETRKLQVEEIARSYRIPLHMLGSLDKTSYATAEQQGIDFAKHTMLPWASRWQHEIRRQLFTADDRRRFAVEFNLDALHMGSLKERYDAYQVARMAGFLSSNEVRHRESLNPLPPEIGDVYLSPLNMVPAGRDAGKEAALSGPQIAAVAQIITSVAQGSLPAQSAIEMVILAIPTVSPEEAARLVNPAAALAVTSPPPPSPPQDSKPTVPTAPTPPPESPPN